MEHPVLELFHPLIRKWFSEKVGAPTDIQAQAWPRIARGEHLLLPLSPAAGQDTGRFSLGVAKADQR